MAQWPPPKEKHVEKAWIHWSISLSWTFQRQIIGKALVYPPIPRQTTGCSAGGFSADPAPVGEEVSTSAPVTMVTGRYVDEELFLSALQCSGHWFGFFCGISLAAGDY